MKPSRWLPALLTAITSALPDDLATALLLPIADGPQSTPDEWDAASTWTKDSGSLLQSEDTYPARVAVRALDHSTVALVNATQDVEESFMRADFKMTSHQRLDLVGMTSKAREGWRGLRLLMSVAIKSNVGTGLVKSIALHLVGESGPPQRLMQVMQLYGEGANDIKQCERGHFVHPQAVLALRERLGVETVRKLSDAKLLAVLVHAGLRQLPPRARQSGSLPAAEAQVRRDEYDALTVLHALEAQLAKGSCDSDESSRFFAQDSTVVEGVQLGAFDAGHAAHDEVAAALRGVLSAESSGADDPQHMKAEL